MKILAISISLLGILSACTLGGISFSEFSGLKSEKATICLYEFKETGEMLPVKNSCKTSNIKFLLSKRQYKTDYIRSIIREGDKTFVIHTEEGKIIVTNPGIVTIATPKRKGDMLNFGSPFYEEMEKAYLKGKNE